MINQLRAKSANVALLQETGGGDEDEFDIDNMEYELPTTDMVTTSAPPSSQLLQQQQADEEQQLKLHLHHYQLQLHAHPQVMIVMPDQTVPPSRDPPTPQQQQQLQSWVCIYPCYLDASKSITQGRRIPKALACTRPAAVYIAETLRQLGFPCAVETSKRHPRDPFSFGRIRAALKWPENHPRQGEWVVSEVQNKMQLLAAVAKHYPETEQMMNLADPMMRKMADASLSQPSMLPQRKPKSDTSKTTVQYITSGTSKMSLRAGTGGKSKSKGKKGTGRKGGGRN